MFKRGNLFSLIRFLIVKTSAITCGSNIYIGTNVEILSLEKISFGNNISIHKDCYIDAQGGLSIGDNVSIAHSSSILTFEHTWSDQDTPIKYNQLKKSEVIINDDVWIGCGCRILSGVNISSRVIVAAGAVVNKDIQPNILVGGVPAKKLKKI